MMPVKLRHVKTEVTGVDISAGTINLTREKCILTSLKSYVEIRFTRPFQFGQIKVFPVGFI